MRCLFFPVLALKVVVVVSEIDSVESLWRLWLLLCNLKRYSCVHGKITTTKGPFS